MSALPESAPEPSPLPGAPAPMCFLLARVMVSPFFLLPRCAFGAYAPTGRGRCVYCGRSPGSYRLGLRETRSAVVRIFYGMRASGWAIMSGIRHVRLLFKDAQLLFVRLWTLHVPNLRPSASDCACDENRSRRLRLILANGDRFCPRMDGQCALATSRGVCGSRERRPGPRCVRYSDVCPA